MLFEDNFIQNGDDCLTAGSGASNIRFRYLPTVFTPFSSNFVNEPAGTPIVKAGMDFRSGLSERLVKSRTFKTSCENIRCVSLAPELIVPISIENIQIVSPHHCLILIRDIISAFFPEKQLIWCSIQELGRRQWSRSKVRSFFLRLLHR